jgi:hypothetical protein
MIDRMLLESNQLPEKPELGILLKGCVTDAERKAVHEARLTLGGFRDDKVARLLGDYVDNVQETGISHQSELPSFLAPNITVVRRCQ